MIMKITKDTPKNIINMQDYEDDKLLRKVLHLDDDEDDETLEEIDRNNEELEYQSEKRRNPLCDNLVGPKEQIKFYYIFGHKFGIRNGIARSAYTLSTRDPRYPEYCHARNISELFEAAIKTNYEKELNGRELSDVPWDEVKSWMKDYLLLKNPDAAKRWTRPDGTEDEYTLLSNFGSSALNDIIDIETYY